MVSTVSNVTWHASEPSSRVRSHFPTVVSTIPSLTSWLTAGPSDPMPPSPRRRGTCDYRTSNFSPGTRASQFIEFRMAVYRCATGIAFAYPETLSNEVSVDDHISAYCHADYLGCDQSLRSERGRSTDYRRDTIAIAANCRSTALASVQARFSIKSNQTSAATLAR